MPTPPAPWAGSFLPVAASDLIGELDLQQNGRARRKGAGLPAEANVAGVNLRDDRRRDQRGERKTLKALHAGADLRADPAVLARAVMPRAVQDKGGGYDESQRKQRAQRDGDEPPELSHASHPLSKENENENRFQLYVFWVICQYHFR